MSPTKKKNRGKRASVAPTPEVRQAFLNVTGKPCTPANFTPVFQAEDQTLANAIREEHIRIMRQRA